MLLFAKFRLMSGPGTKRTLLICGLYVHFWPKADILVCVGALHFDWCFSNPLVSWCWRLAKPVTGCKVSR